MKSSKSSLEWQKIPYLMTVVHECGRSLGLMIAPLSPKRFAAMAVEGPSGSDIQAIMADHGHAVIGEKFRSLRAAKEAATKFSRRWAKHVRKMEASIEVAQIVPACDCSDLTESFLN